MRRIYVDTLIYGFSKFLPGVINLATVVIFSRVLGETNFGLYALVLAVILSGASLGSGWAKQAILRYHSEYKNSGNTIVVKSYLYISFISSTIAAITTGIALIVLGHVELLSYRGMLIAMYASAGYALFNIEEGRQQSMFRPVIVTINHLIKASVILISGIFIFHTFNTNFISALLAVAFGVTVAVIFSRNIIGFSYVKEDFNSDSNMHHIRKYWSFGWPIGLWMTLMTLIPVIDRSMIDYFLGASAAGVYSCVYEIIIKGYAVVTFPITFALHPHIMKLANSGDNSSAYSLVIRGFLFQLLLMITIGIICYFGDEVLLDSILLMNDPDAPILLIILVFASGFWQLALLAHKPLEIRGKTKLMLLFILLSVGVNFIANFILIPFIGIIGASISTLLSGCIYLSLVFFNYNLSKASCA